MLPGSTTNVTIRGSGSDSVSPGAKASTGGRSGGAGATVGGVVLVDDGIVIVVVLPEPVALGAVVVVTPATDVVDPQPGA